MKSLIYNIAIFLFIILLFTTCKKYPEGGYHYNYLKHLKGQWSLKLYEVNGIDSTNLIPQANMASGYLNDFATFNVLHSGKRAEIYLNSYARNYDVYINNKKRDAIEFLAQHTDLQLTRDVFMPTEETYFDWKIEKLTESELILKSTLYDYKLILIKK